MNLKNQLKLYLDATGMTASQCARKSVVPRQRISAWLLGHQPKDLKQLKRVADTFKTTVDQLCFGCGLDHEARKTVELEALLGDRWVSGVFEVRLKRASPTGEP